MIFDHWTRNMNPSEKAIIYLKFGVWCIDLCFYFQSNEEVDSIVDDIYTEVAKLRFHYNNFFINFYEKIQR